jgi:methoxymalonate biosynthesis acyl carrier protein
MTDDSALADRIGRIFFDTLNIEAPSIDADLFETGVLDSLAFVELLLRLEREFGLAISVDDLEVENFKSIARIAEFIKTRAEIQPLRLVQNSTRR